MGVPVVYAPLALQPDVGRVYATIPEGWTIEQIICDLMPDMPDAVLDRVVVTMINGKSSARVPRRVWHRVRPFAGTQIVIMVAPGRGALNLLISIAAIAISAFVFPVGAAGIFGLGLQGSRALLSFGITALGGLLLNALFPVKKEKEEKPTYAVSGWANEYRPDAVIPRVFGTVRYAPPLAAFSYIEIVGDLIYNRMVLCWGFGPVELSDLKNGETLLTKYDEIEIEHRYGHSDDEPLTLYTQQVVEEKVGTDLVREFQRDDSGEPLPGGWEAPVDEKPIERTTARDCSHAIVVLSFPAGLGYINSKNKKIAYYVFLGVRIKREPDGVWEAKPDIVVRAKKFAGFFRALRFDFDERGAYTIELTRKSPSEQPEDDVGTYVLTCTWAVLQSWRPEYPFNFGKPVALTAVRVKSTYQLNGALDALNGIVKGVEPDLDGTEWGEQASQNPASHALYALRGPMLFRPVPDDMIDLAWFAEWHAFCVEKGLKYNRVHDFDESLGERLAATGAAGRAAVRWDGRRWTGTIDRPREIPADFITPRNSSGISISASYFEPPHAYRVQFIDETNEFQPATRDVPWPGHDGAITIVENIEMPGKTDPDEIWIETRRRQYEMLHRSCVYSATQQGLARTSTTGDLVLASRDIVRRTMSSARVRAVRGNLVELDETTWTMEEGVEYAIRFRQFDADDTIGDSVVRTIATVAGENSAVTMTGTGESPAAGDLVMFGPAGSDSYRLIVVEIERGKDNAAILTMLPEAAIIDELTDAEVPPVWSGRVGAEIEPSADAPEPPVITEVLSGVVETEASDGLIIILRPATGDPVVIETYEVEHRLSGSGTWLGPVDGTEAEGSVDLSGIYALGDKVEIHARAVSVAGVSSAYGPTIEITVGEADDGIPLELPAGSISVTGGLGYASIAFATGADPATKTVQVYRRDGSGSLNRATDALGAAIPVSPSQSYVKVHGDTSRVNLLGNSDFAVAGTWTLGTGFAIGSGVLQKGSGSASVASQAISMTVGASYRAALSIIAYTAGTITLRLSGGSNVDSAAYGSVARHRATLVAVTGNNTFAVSAGSTFQANMDNAVLYEETTACAPQGENRYWLEPINDDGTPGPISGPFSVTLD